MDLKIPKARDAAKISKMPLNDGTWNFFFLTDRVKTVSVFQTGFLRLLALSSDVPLLSLFAVPNILYLNHPPLNMSYWLACVPYFRIKDAKGESDLAVLLLPLCMHIHTNTHISFLYLHTHTHKNFFFHMMRPQTFCT